MQGHILLERTLPLSWRRIETAEAAQAAHVNQVLFAMLESVEETLPHKTETETPSELNRIEAKLNVILALLGELLQARQQRPAPVALRFTNETLAWQVTQPLPVGSLLAVSLYPDTAIPMALQFTGKVLSSSEHWVEVDMHSLGEDELAIWSRWVFRQHRRHVAQVRAYPDKT